MLGWQTERTWKKVVSRRMLRVGVDGRAAVKRSRRAFIVFKEHAAVTLRPTALFLCSCTGMTSWRHVTETGICLTFTSCTVDWPLLKQHLSINVLFIRHIAVFEPRHASPSYPALSINQPWCSVGGALIASGCDLVPSQEGVAYSLGRHRISRSS